MENSKNPNNINDIDTTTCDDTAAIEAMYRLMLEADTRAKKEAVAKDSRAYDIPSLVGGIMEEYVAMMQEFCMEFAQFWAITDSIVRKALRQGEGIVELVYDHSSGELFYGETLVGKTEVRLDEALVRRYLQAEGWREDAKRYGLFYYDLRKQVLESLS